MKSSSLGARLFEGLVQPILGSLWNSPPAVEKKADDTSSLSKSNRKTHIQGRIISSAQHPTSSYAETSAVRGSGLHQRDLSSENVAITVIGHKNASRRHQEQAATRPLSSGNRPINTVALGEISGGTPPTAQGRLRGRKQTRVLQRYTSRRSNENTQGLIKETPNASVPAAATAEATTAIAGGSRTRCVVRHRVADAVPGVSVNVLKSQRVRQQKGGDRRRKSAALTQASSSSSVVPSEKQQCTSGKQNLSFVEAKGSQGSSSSMNAMLYETAAARANDVTNTRKKWNPLQQRSNGGDNVIETFSRLNNRNRSKNSGPGSSSYLTERNDIRACTKCNCGSSDCNNSNSSSSSSAWGNSSSDECVFTAENSSVSFGESSDPAADTHRNVQVWLNTRIPCSSGQQQQTQKQQGLEEQQHGCLKHQIHHVQADHSTLKCATTSVGEEDSRETRLHLWQSAASSPDCNAAVSAAVPKEKSCSGGPCPQCSDTTTTCSSSSMTSCGDARDTATTGSAATMLEHPQQHYLDIDEQMPLAFLTTTAEDHTLGHNEEAAPLLPCAQNDSHQVVVASTQYSSSLGGGAAASSSGTSCIDLATDISSSPPLSSLTSASSGCKYTAAASRHLENKILGVTNTSLPSCVVSSSHAHQKEEAAATAGKQSAGDNNIEECFIPVSNTKGHQQQCHHLQNSAGAAAAPAAASMMNVAVDGHQDDNAATVFVSAKEACVSDRLEQLQNEQQQQQQPSNQTEGGASVGSVIFGHRVLKPLRSKSLEENYDALVEIVAFTKRRCERETMELLRKDVHILYYARGLHHAAHVETYLQQQQNQKEKQQQGSSIASRNNSSSNSATLKLHSGEGGMSATSGSGLHVGNDNLKSSSDGASASSAAVMAATSSPSAEKKNLTTPCFPSVSAALANGARPRPVPDWATPEALRKAMKQQQCYDPFSIFGEAPPELLLSEVYDEQHYTHISPQTRASHPVLAKLKQQRRVALMTVFQQKRVALARAHHMLEQELAQLQQQQQQQQQRSSMSHETFSSMLGRVVLSCGSGIQTSTTIGGAAVKTENIMNRKCSSNNGALSSFLQLKNTQDKENKNIKEKEAMLRLQQREVLIQQQLLERRVEEQLQQEEKIHNEVLRNGFRFTGAARSNGGGGGEYGSILFKKRVLPALEAWWRQQCQVELDWRNDPLTSEECSWYREVMHAAVDASDIISVQQACFCPTPPPYRQWTWTDCRVRQRKQHEQNLAKQQLLLQQQQQQQRHQQLLLQQQEQSSRGGGHGVHRAIEWGDEQSDDGEKKEMTCVVDRCIAAANGGDGDNETTDGVAADYKKRYPEEIIIAGMRSRCRNSQETAEDLNCDDESMSSSPEEKKRNGQLLAVRTPCSRRGRKRRAKEGDHNTTPQALVENNKIEETHHGPDERDIATTNNSGSARKRPRSFCRQARKIQFHHHAQTDQSLNVQNVKECFSSRGCACDGCLSKDNLPKQRCCHNSLRRTKSKTLFSKSASIAAAAAGPAAAGGGGAAAADKCSHTSNIESSGSKATAVILPQSFCHSNEQRSSDIYSNGSAGTCNNVSNRGNGRSGFFSPHQARLGGTSGSGAISTPVAKMQALKLSNQQRFLSTAPLQHTQQRDKAVDRGQQPLQCSVMVVPPSHKATEFSRVTSLHEQAFVSPSPVTAETNTAADHLPSNWTGNGTPDAAGRSACDITTGTPNSMGVAAAVAAAAAAGVCCGGGAGGEHSNIATRGGPCDECSSTSIESRCRSGGKHVKQQIKINASQRFTRQLQKHIIRSAAARAATQESCLSTYNAGASGSLVSSAGTHSRLGIGGVREVSKRKSVRTDQAAITGLTSKNICIKENATSRNLYLSSKNHVRPTTLLTTRCARLSIDRVYGHRRTSDLFHNRSRSQYVLSSLGRPDITSAIRSTDERGGIAMDSICKKDIECMNNEVP